MQRANYIFPHQRYTDIRLQEPGGIICYLYVYCNISL